MSPLPAPDFTLAGDVLEAELDQLAHCIATAEHGAAKPVYAIGAPGFVKHCSGADLTRMQAEARLARHRAVAEPDSHAGPMVREAARVLADQLAAVLAQSFAQEEA